MNINSYYDQQDIQGPRQMALPEKFEGEDPQQADLVERLTRQVVATLYGSEVRIDGQKMSIRDEQSLLVNTSSTELSFSGMPQLSQTARQPHFYFLPETAMPRPSPQMSRPLDVYHIRQDFPVLQRMVHGKPLLWLDNAATTQKPRQVIEALSRFYTCDNSNVHRGAHALANQATEAYEKSRAKVQQFIGASSAREIIFVRGTTEAINLVAQTYGRQQISAGDEILVTTLEHHSNIVPWQLLCQEKGAQLRVVPLDDSGEVMLEEYERLLGPRTRLVAIAHVSNTLGTVLPVKQMAALAHRQGIRVLVDGAQAVAHLPVNVQDLGVDFYAFSGHKLFGPTGIAVLYGKQELLEGMPAWQGGGNMIENVTFEKTTYAQIPHKFEAGTGHIAGVIGMGAALDYLQNIDFQSIMNHEEQLMAYTRQAVEALPGVRLIGTSPRKVGVLSFVLKGTDTQEVGKYLDREGIALRTGHHCAQPSLRRFGVESTIRPSFAFYNTREEVNRLISALRSYMHFSR